MNQFYSHRRGTTEALAAFVLAIALTPLVQAKRGVWFEIAGYTDSTGDEAYNQKLGEERAMAVRNYLAMKHNIGLNRLNVISYGESDPVADNKTREGRAQNRRVVIKILE